MDEVLPPLLLIQSVYLSIDFSFVLRTGPDGWTAYRHGERRKLFKKETATKGEGKKERKEKKGGKERINPGFLAGSDQRRESPLYSGLGCCYMVMKGWDRVEYRKRERERASRTP